MLRFIITWQTILEANRSALVGYIYVGVVQCVVKWNRSSCCCCFFFFRCGKIVIFFLSGKIGTLKKTYFFDLILRGFFVVFLFFSFFFFYSFVLFFIFDLIIFLFYCRLVEWELLWKTKRSSVIS